MLLPSCGGMHGSLSVNNSPACAGIASKVTTGMEVDRNESDTAWRE